MTKPVFYTAEQGGKVVGGGVIQALARTLLEEKLIDGIFAFVEGFDERDLRPAFITNPGDVASISLAPYMPFSLARIAHDYGPSARFGLISRPCDIRACTELGKRNMFDLSTLYMIAIGCEGTRDAEGQLRDSCTRCEYRTAASADLNCFVGKGKTAIQALTEKGAKLLALAKLTELAVSDDPLARLEGLEAEAAARQADAFAFLNDPPEERFLVWSGQHAKCFKCYGCRDVCPICYCRDCSLKADRGLVAGGVVPPSPLFHLARMAHMADSCVNCGQCQDACPADIPIARYFQAVQKRLQGIFGYVPGVDTVVRPPLTQFGEAEMQFEDTILGAEVGS